MYNTYMHGIEEVVEDDLESKKIFNKDRTSFAEKDSHSCWERSLRVSLTIRHFPKILNLKLKFGVR